MSKPQFEQTRRRIAENPASWQQGYDAGREGRHAHATPAGVDTLAYWAGVIEGKANRAEENRQRYFEMEKARKR